MGVQAFGPEASIEGFDEGIVGPGWPGREKSKAAPLAWAQRSRSRRSEEPRKLPLFQANSLAVLSLRSINTAHVAWRAMAAAEEPSR